MLIRHISCTSNSSSATRNAQSNPFKALADCSLLGCPEGRSAAGWVDYNLFGHQIVCHQVNGYNASATANAVDGDPVPVPHFGLALSVQQFHDLADRVKQAGVKFVIQPHLRFEGAQSTSYTLQHASWLHCSCFWRFFTMLTRTVPLPALWVTATT